MKPIGKFCGALAIGALALGGIKGCDAYDKHKAEVKLQESIDQYMKTFRENAWILDPESGKMIECKPIHVDTIRVKDVNIADSLINEGLKIDLPRLDSIMQTNYAKGLLSVDTVKKAAKVIR